MLVKQMHLLVHKEIRKGKEKNNNKTEAVQKHLL